MARKGSLSFIELHFDKALLGLAVVFLIGLAVYYMSGPNKIEYNGQEVGPDAVAKVIVDERTGTIVMGSNVRISTCAVAHGSLSIQVKETKEVSQPLPFSQGETVVVPETAIQVTEQDRRLMLLDPGVSLGEVVDALNAIGATPRELIAILQSLKAAGALQARLEII